MRTCEVPGCDAPGQQNGFGRLCSAHACRLSRWGDIRADKPVRRKHGLSYHPLHAVWLKMLDRCRRPSNPDYKNYGGRGISVCERWQSFPNFLADMGERPEGMTLERKDNDGDYCPSNCVWATRKQQRANQRRPV